MEKCLVVVLTLTRFSLNILSVNAVSHWVVTEDGRIQAEMDSMYNMRRPYDLMSLLKQGERVELIEELKVELLDRKTEIDKNEDKDTGLEQRFYKTDPDCVIAEKPLPEFDLYISTVLPLENKGIRPENHIDFKARPKTVPVTPDCTKVGVDLDFSMHAFEHLLGMKDRANLSGSPELGLKNAIAHRDNVDDYGNLVLDALHKNNTSWVLYNMAAFYWRIKGSPYHVIECLRRALHFSPREHKDVALISLANVLHRAHYSFEAAIVVHAAIDVSKELNVNHFTLGNIYAVLRDYNNSVICFENTLSLQPDFEAASKLKHAVKCHAKLEEALENQHKSLQRTLDELKDYQRKHAQWQTQQERLMSEQASPDTKLEQAIAYEMFMDREQDNANGYGQVCRQWDDEIRCSWERKRPFLAEEDFRPQDDAMNGQDEIDPLDYSVPKHPPLYTIRHPPLPKGIQLKAFEVADWPEKEECDLFVLKVPAWNEFPTTYLSPENKGFEVKPLLADAQGLAKDELHPLPWYPPVCATLTDIPEGPKSFDHIQSVKDRSQIPPKLFDTSMKQVLLDHVDSEEATEEEIGQRIMTALKQKIGPNWVMYNLAGLYWRIIGNSFHGIECVRRALYFVPDEYRDIPLVNLANILYKWGRVVDAITVAREALAVNSLEPETHYLLGNLLAANSNLSGSIYHYEEALHQEPMHHHAMDSLRTIKCYQKFHRNAQSAAAKAPLEDKAGCVKEPKVLCKNEFGRETCMVETGIGECETCKQMCSVTPVKVAGCTARPVTGKKDSTIVCKEAKCEMIEAVSAGVSEEMFHGLTNTDQCPHATSSSATPKQFNPLDDPELAAHLDQVIDYYREKGVCNGDDCHKLMMQTEKPHTKLVIIDDVMHHHALYGDPDNIKYEPGDCIIFNSGGKTPGCNLEIYRPFNLDLTDIPSLTNFPPNWELHKGAPLPPRLVAEHKLAKSSSMTAEDMADIIDKLKQEQQHIHDQMTRPAAQRTEVVCERRVRVHKESSTGEKSGDARSGSRSSTGGGRGSASVTHMSDEEIIRTDPDPTRNIRALPKDVWPQFKWCQNNWRQLNFPKFESTLVLVTSKNINVRDYIDFESEIPVSATPRCDASLLQDNLPVDQIKQLLKPKSLRYTPEVALKEAFKNLNSVKSETVQQVGSRIAYALQGNGRSWVLNSLAALHWRIQGDAAEAILCSKLAYQFAPDHAKDIPLLSLANILHKSGHLKQALKLTNAALEHSPEVVALHFSVANLYAALEDWVKATQFYQATLALQSSFLPARERLLMIQCNKVLANPHHYKDNPAISTYDPTPILAKLRKINQSRAQKKKTVKK